MKTILVALSVLFVAVAILSHYVFDSSLVTFICSASALILLSKFMGEATEHLAHHVGESYAGLVNVSLGNLAELIIIFTAVRSGMIELVKAGIVGSVVGNTLLVMGISVIVACRKGVVVKLKPETVALYINQLFLVGAILILPSVFSEHTPVDKRPMQSYLLAAMLSGAYVLYSIIFHRDERMKLVHNQASEAVKKTYNGWSGRRSIIILLVTSAVTFFVSDLLINEVEPIAHHFNLSNAMLGFMLLPLLGNVAEHFVAVTAAWKGLAELSLSVAVGSASQVGMIVAPAAVLFGAIYGVEVTLDFSGLPFQLLLITLVAAYIVLRDNQWRRSEGIMLLVCYLAIMLCFTFVN